MILRIGKAIHYDFSKDFSDLEKLNKYKAKDRLSVTMEDATVYNNEPDYPVGMPWYWKNKYLELLEDYNKLLKDYFTKFKDKK